MKSFSGLLRSVAVLLVLMFAPDCVGLSSCHRCVAHFNFMPQHKLMFCWIEKVGCTRFKKLIPGERLYEWYPRESFSSIVQRVMRDPTWHKAMFYREPLSRFLSGYLDKCTHKIVRVYCNMVFGSWNTTFDEAISFLKTANPHKIDAHFRQQSDHCGGMGYGAAKYFQTKELLEPETSREKVAAMLNRSNALNALRGVFNGYFPPTAKKGGDSHDTHAHSRLEEYYADPRHVSTVVNFFYRDYITFQIPLPAFAREALTKLAKDGSSDAMEPTRLEVLLNITGNHR